VRAVLERDFLSQVGRPRAFVFRTLTAALVATVLLLVVVENSRTFDRRPDEAARLLFTGGSITVLCLLAILTPPSVIGAVLEERQRETLPLVLATPVGPFAFAAAKLLARSLAVLLWAAAALVPLAAVLLLGGVSGSQVLDFALLSTGVVLEMAGWGVAVSSVSRRLATAAVLGYLLPLVRWVAFFVAALLLLEPPRGTPASGPRPEHPGPPTALLLSTPMPALVHMMEPRVWDRGLDEIYSASGGSPPALGRQPAVVFLLAGLSAAAAGVLAAGLRLRREGEPRRPGAPGWLLNRLRRPVPDGSDALKWKETRLLNAAASRPLYYTVLVLLGASEVIFVVACSVWLVHDREIREFAFGLLGAQATLLGLVGAVVGAASIAHERVLGTLDLLRVSPVTPAAFLRAKAAGALRGVAFLSLFPLVHLVVLGATGIAATPTIALGAGLAVLIPAFWTWIGVTAGLASRTPATAVARVGAAFGVMLVALPIVAVVVEETFRARDLGEFLVTGWHPATVFLALDASEITFHREALPYWRHSARLGDEHAGALVWIAACVAATLCLLWRAPRVAAERFDRERDGG